VPGPSPNLGRAGGRRLPGLEAGNTRLEALWDARICAAISITSSKPEKTSASLRLWASFRATTEAMYARPRLLPPRPPGSGAGPRRQRHLQPTVALERCAR
jgi:hypothetical protein